MATPKIIDTNVPLTAIMTDDMACQMQCIQVVKDILNGQIIVVMDDQNAALKEYRQQMYPDPNPSAGLASQFLMYLLTYQYNVTRVYRAKVMQNAGTGAYLLYPLVASVQKFDPSDKKWVAIALTYQQETQKPAPIVNATDSDWLHFASAFEQLGIQIEFLCPNLLKTS